MHDLVRLTDSGLYCAAGDFYIDPWRRVERAIVTHAHSDHARPGSCSYLTTRDGLHVLRERVGHDAVIDVADYGQTIDHRGVRVSLHPAGHVLGSAQVRVEHNGYVVVASGDYKLAADPTCAAFEPAPCHTFITEATFALPIYRWRSPNDDFADVSAWWAANQELCRTSIIYGYSLGKAQRIIASLDAAQGPILVHGAVQRFVDAYTASGIQMPPVEHATAETVRAARGRAIVVAPPSAEGSPWLKRFGSISEAVASGWMRIRGTRRRRSVDRGFAISDHADWDGLVEAVRATGAERILVTHGYTAVFARWLAEQGLAAEVLATRFEGEGGAEGMTNDEAPMSNQ